MSDLPVLAVAGPRPETLGAKAFLVALDVDRFFAQLEPRHLVVHGAAQGVDLMCADAALRHGHEVKAYPTTRADADRARERRGSQQKAPLERTVRMLDDARPDLARVWWDGASAGTGFTVGELRRRKIPTAIVRYDATPKP